VIVLRDSGTVPAPSYQVGSILCYNAFRYGVVERSRGSLSDEVLTGTVNVTGPPALSRPARGKHRGVPPTRYAAIVYRPGGRGSGQRRKRFSGRAGQ
jgi:hypothetical protein